MAQGFCLVGLGAGPYLGKVCRPIKMCTDGLAVFVDRPTNRTSMVQDLFKVGPGAGFVAHTNPAFPKMPRAPLEFPY